MTRTGRLLQLRQWIAAAAITAVLVVIGFGARHWFVHAHDDHGLHGHAGHPVPGDPIDDSSSNDWDGDEHGHGVAAGSFDLIATPPTAGRVTAPRPSESRVVAMAIASARLIAPSTAPPARAAPWWHPPPPVIADSGTSRVLRTSHALLF